MHTTETNDAKPRSPIKRVYAWILTWGQCKQATWALAAFSFAESSFFPIPPDPLLMATVNARPKQWVKLASICTGASILGGLFGYFVGVALFDSLGSWVLDTYHLTDKFDSVEELYQENTFLALFGSAISPIPYKVFTIAAGVFRVSIPMLIIASTLGRGLRFFTEAYFMQKLGSKYQDKIARYIDVLSLLFLLLMVGGFVAIKFLA